MTSLSMSPDYIGEGVCRRISPFFRGLLADFPCADVVCSFCGYLAQVKLHTATNWENESVV